METNSNLEESTSKSQSQGPLTTRTGHVRRPNWTTAEDEQLCRSWLKNSFDPTTNAIQKGTQFWHRVADDFASRAVGGIERNKDHVRNRWQLLQAKVIKFTACYERIQRLQGDKPPDEVVAEALRAYEREETHKFTFYSSWLILRNSNRWKQWTASAAQRRSTSSSFRDIPVSPLSTVSLLDSEGSPSADQSCVPPLVSSNGSGGAHTTDSATLGTKTEKPAPGHQSCTASNPHPSTSSSAYPTATRPHHRRHYRYSTQHNLGENEEEDVDRMMAMAMKRKVEVQEAALEVQLLSMNPDHITDPLRKEVYTMKMEEIRDRYRAKRGKPTPSHHLQNPSGILSSPHLLLHTPAVPPPRLDRLDPSITHSRSSPANDDPVKDPSSTS